MTASLEGWLFLIMQPDERTRFLKWIAPLSLKAEVLEKLLAHLPDHRRLHLELPYWIESATRIISMNDPKNCFGLPKDPIEEGFLVIGSCPNGDLVAVSFRDERLPVFYISHEQMHSEPLSNVIRKVSDSIDDYDEALSNEKSGIPLDYWDTPKSEPSQEPRA
jgi:hypothetical protein